MFVSWFATPSNLALHLAAFHRQVLLCAVHQPSPQPDEYWQVLISDPKLQELLPQLALKQLRAPLESVTIRAQGLAALKKLLSDQGRSAEASAELLAQAQPYLTSSEQVRPSRGMT